MLYLVLILLIIMLIGWLWVLALQLSYSFDHRRIVFFPTIFSSELQINLIKLIQNYVFDTHHVKLIELGCGVAHVSRFLQLKFNWQEVQGLEIDRATCWLAHLFNWFSPIRVPLRRADILQVDLPPQSVLYCYLGGDLMRLLYDQEKFYNQLVISLTFRIPDVEPTEVVELSKLHHRFVVYDFREKS
jgi:hypothetical protein